MDWARTARSERERATFIRMAETWLQAAALLEACENTKGRSFLRTG
jgi:hypothetical protein